MPPECDLQNDAATPYQPAVVLQLAPDPYFVMDGEGLVLYCNRAAETTFGWAHAEIVGQNSRAILPEGVWEICQRVESPDAFDRFRAECRAVLADVRKS
jgi:PAS domain S-box-containing protein